MDCGVTHRVLITHFRKSLCVSWISEVEFYLYKLVEDSSLSSWKIHLSLRSSVWHIQQKHSENFDKFSSQSKITLYWVNKVKHDFHRADILNLIQSSVNIEKQLLYLCQTAL